MAPHAVLARAGAALVRSEPCVFCIARQFRRPVHQHALRQEAPRPRTTSGNGVQLSGSIQRRQVAIFKGLKKNAPQPRASAEGESLARLNTFKKMAEERAISVEPVTAEAIVKEFAATGKANHITIVEELAQKYKVDKSVFTQLAHACWVSHSSAASNRRISRDLMLALSLAGESGAILHIMRAYYLKGSKEACATYLSNFNKAEILSVRKQLEALATAQDKSKQNPDILTLWGMFLEMDGRTDEARALYEAAVEIAPTEFKPSTGISEGISFPQLAPWNALGLLLLAENTPESLESAKKAFRRGALKADDPVSYYHLANLMTKGSGTWLHYMTKAAGSGHRDAMHALGIFYGKGTAQELVDKSDDSYFRRLMRWFLNMPPKSMTLIAAEWLTEGCKAGHKPSMLALVDYIDNSPRGKKETREESIDEVKRHWLEQIMKAPRGGERERWPDVVKDATKRLSEMGNKGIKKAAK